MGIIVKWWEGERYETTEYLDGIDPDNLKGLQQVDMITTQEWGHQRKRWANYNVNCLIESNGQGANGGHNVVLTYSRANNSRLIDEDGYNEEDFDWGKIRYSFHQDKIAEIVNGRPMGRDKYGIIAGKRIICMKKETFADILSR